MPCSGWEAVRVIVLCTDRERDIVRSDAGVEPGLGRPHTHKYRYLR